MKKVLSFIFCITMIFALTGCGKDSPEKTTETFLKALKKQDVATMEKVYAGDPNHFDFTKEAEGQVEPEILDKINEIIYDFDFKVLGESISEDKTRATVTVEFTAHNIGKIFTDTLRDYITEAFSRALSGSRAFTEEDAEKLLVEIFIQKASENEKDYVTQQNIVLEKNSKDEWVVANITEQSGLLDALLYGVEDAIAEYFS